MKYRREIDGLRAIAVMSVIFFHAGFDLFSGGFVGVDIFFVISGYLITRLILEALEQGSFSIRQFYVRRARRILPALFTVMFTCIPFAFFWMLPSQYEDFSQSVMAVIFFSSNLLFWRESGYFAAEASEKPLLHTWSLGVEEQYYLLMPLALMAIWRFGRRPAFYAIIIAAAVSLLLCEYASRYYINLNFFLLPTRAWELLVGSLCAFAPTRTSASPHNGIAVLGLGFIMIAIFFYNEQMRLPSLYTLLPVLGVALILHYGTAGSWVANLLSQRVSVGIGLISYSAYLWHFPLFAFARVRTLSAPDTWLMAGLSFGSLLLGAITWRLVEQPFRQKQHRWYVSNRRALLLAIIAVTLLAAVGLYGYLSHGRLAYWVNHAAPNKVRAFQLLESAHQEYRFFDNGDCVFRVNLLSAEVENKLATCRKKYGPGIALIGDSHAINLFFLLKENIKSYPFVAGISQGMCRPHTNMPTCYYDRLLEIVERHPGLFKEIIYEQTGSTLIQNPHGKLGEYPRLIELPLEMPVMDYPLNTAYIDAVAAYLTKLAQFSRVTWLGPRVEPRLRPYAIIHLGCDYPFHLRPNQESLFKKLDGTIRDRLHVVPVHYRSQIDILKFDMKSDFISCERTYFVDGNHYSPDGEQRFAKRMTLRTLLQSERAE